MWVSAPNQVYLTGSTSSWDFPWQFNFQPFTGDVDVFITELDPTTAGSGSLLISTPLGGTSQPSLAATAAANGIAVDPSGNVYLAGATTSGDFPRAVNLNNGFQLTCASCQQTPPATDAFMVEVAPNAGNMPSVSFNVAKVNFGTQPIGSLTVPPQAVAVENTGDAALTVSSLTITGTNSDDFSAEFTTGCTATSPAPGGICSFEITFVPSIVGVEGAFLTVSDDAGTGSQILEIVGHGGGPLVSFSPVNIDFSNVPVGTMPSAPVLIGNTGNQPLLITNIQITGANAALFPPTSGGCPGTSGSSGGLPPGSNCTMFVSFDPTAAGTFQAQIAFTDNSQGVVGSMQLVPIVGTEVSSAAVANISPATLSFPTQPVGTMSGPQTLTVTNVGSAALNLTGLAITGSNAASFGYYTRGNSACQLPPGTLAMGASCTTLVDFIPQGAGAANAAITFSDNATGSPQIIALSGSGIAPTEVSVVPDSIAFGTQTVGLATPPVPITLTNTGNSVMTISQIAISPATATQFAATNTCAPTLSPKSNCVITATFNAQQAGIWTATIFLADDATESPQAISLSATSVAVTASIAPPGPINFGSQLVGTDSASIPVTVSNTGMSPSILKVLGATVADITDFKLTNNCNASLSAAGSCTLALAFDPGSAPAIASCGSTAGAKNSVLTITDNAATSPQSVSLSASAMDYCVEPPGSTTQTVVAGAAATYSLDVASFGGFTGTVVLSCASATLQANCTPQPASLAVAAGALVPFQVNSTTTAGAADLPYLKPSGWRGILPMGTKIRLALLGLLVVLIVKIPVLRHRFPRLSRSVQTGVIGCLLVVGVAGCFGGGKAAPAVATASGTYTLTVTAMYGGATRTLPLTLVVQ